MQLFRRQRLKTQDHLISTLSYSPVKAPVDSITGARPTSKITRLRNPHQPEAETNGSMNMQRQGPLFSFPRKTTQRCSRLGGAERVAKTCGLGVRHNPLACSVKVVALVQIGDDRVHSGV